MSPSTCQSKGHASDNANFKTSYNLNTLAAYRCYDGWDYPQRPNIRLRTWLTAASAGGGAVIIETSLWPLLMSARAVMMSQHCFGVWQSNSTQGRGSSSHAHDWKFWKFSSSHRADSCWEDRSLSPFLTRVSTFTEYLSINLWYLFLHWVFY